MATNKNALIRYKILDNCFRNPGKRYFIKDLILECEKVLMEIDPDSNGISRRQIFDDISFMESKEGWQIDLAKQRDGKKVYYRYSDISFSINNMPLNEVEIGHLKSALEILSQFKGMPQFEWIHELLPKLQQGASTIDEKDAIIEFDNNQYLAGIEFLGVLHNAINYKKVLNITYQPFESDHASDFVIHPYYLKQYNNRWFLFGLNPGKNQYDWNLALDRIRTIKEIKGKFIKNSQIDWKEYFEDIIGVTKPHKSKVEKITLQFIGKTGKYILSKPMHGSQKSKWINDKLLEVNLQLIINYEFESLLLSYGDNIKVVSPLKLVKSLTKRMKNAIALYL